MRRMQSQAEFNAHRLPDTPVAARVVSAAELRLVRAGIETARLDAEVLMAEAAGTSRAAILAGLCHLDGVAMDRFERMIERRAAREPLAYIIGHREFHSLEFEVGPEVLIPRPETETLVECALGFLKGRPRASVMDIGTGSGAVAIAIAVNAPAARIVAIDISKTSLEMARRNARCHGCEGRISFVRGDFLTMPANRWDGGSFDLMVSNPPYVAENEFAVLPSEVRDHEPRAALAGGRDGLDFYRAIAAVSLRWLGREGEVVVEVGAGQADAVEEILRAGGCGVTARTKDLAGIDRVLRARAGA